MPAKFTHTNRADFKTQLFERLGDLSRSFWTNDEANVIIDEAIRTYGGIAQAFKSQVEIILASPNVFYDITSNLNIDQELLAFQITYQDLLTQINFHLMEEISASNLVSSITSLEEILKFARSRINQYQQLTGLVLTKSNYNMASPPINLLTVNDELIDIVRVAFFDSITEKYYRLREDDETDISYNRINSFSTTNKIPSWYTTLLGTLNEIWIYPPPLNASSLEIVSINGIAATTAIALADIIPLPNNLTHYVKWGILIDIFSKTGLANDPNRAMYCQERWNEGIIIGQNYTSILAAQLNGRPIMIDDMASLDNEDTGWQNKTGKPSFVGSIGYNLLAVNKIPNDIYSLQMFSVTNAYVPIDDDDFIDIKPEYVEDLLSYCIHLSSIKNGAEAIKETNELKDGFLKMSVNHNLRLQQRGITYSEMMKKTKLQQIQEPIEVKEAA